MKYKCLVFDHDDTVVNSTATIHHPCFQLFLDEHFPGRRCSLEHYFLKNFSPGFLEMCREEYGMDEALIAEEGRFWLDYVKSHIPAAYPGVREIMQRQKEAGGLVAVVSHSHDTNIRRDWAANGFPAPDAVYGWERPEEERKPSPFPLEDIMRRFSLSPRELLVIDDLKPGYDMARAVGADFAAVGWANDIGEIEAFMRKNCALYFKTVEELDAYLR